jgi:hypothetical protein
MKGRLHGDRDRNRMKGRLHGDRDRNRMKGRLHGDRDRNRMKGRLHGDRDRNRVALGCVGSVVSQERRHDDHYSQVHAVRGPPHRACQRAELHTPE